jgi:hypothetical protein
MYETLEILYFNFCNWIFIFFEAMTCRTKFEYEPCDIDKEDVYTSF